jgi:molybdate transport system substrate-binding protein
MRSWLAALFLFASTVTGATPLYIAAASDLVFCMEELNAAFKRREPDADIKLTAGSSGNFHAQIRNGAPFDVFLSADLAYPNDLAASGHADARTLTRYAIGRVVLWTTNPGVDVSVGLAALTQPAIKRIAIANPEHAPYGRAAKAAIEQAGLWDAVKSRLTLGENISQTAQFVQSGNAEAGLIALSLVMAPKMRGIGKYFLLPQDSHPVLEQGAILTRRGTANPLAMRYMQYLRSADARAIFGRYGFALP